ELARGPQVLDVGCGDGSLTKVLAEHFENVFGVDCSREKIRLAKETVPRGEFHESLFEEFETRDRFDSIIMINFLEHVEDPILCFEKARNLLKPEGRVIVFVPNALSLNRRIGKLMGLIESCYELTSKDLSVGHKRFYDRCSLIRDIEKSSLCIIEIGGIFLKPLSNKQMESWDEAIFDALYEISGELPDYCGLIYASAGVIQDD
ncbi:unnamed protein product, partial [marine sediment metagenome]